MIIVQSENGEVNFINEREYTNCAFRKEYSLFFAFPIHQNREIIKVEDVVSVTYTNDVQPTSQTFNVKQVEPERESTPISVLIEEVKRVEYFEKRNIPHKSNISGFGVRLSHTCNTLGINTVEELVEYGHTNLRESKYIGRKCIRCIDKALKNLGIEKW